MTRAARASPGRAASHGEKMRVAMTRIDAQGRRSAPRKRPLRRLTEGLLLGLTTPRPRSLLPVVGLSEQRTLFPEGGMRDERSRRPSRERCDNPGARSGPHSGPNGLLDLVFVSRPAVAAVATRTALRAHLCMM